MREKVRFPFVVSTISFSELLTTFIDGWEGERERNNILESLIQQSQLETVNKY